MNQRTPLPPGEGNGGVVDISEKGIVVHSRGGEQSPTAQTDSQVCTCARNESDHLSQVQERAVHLKL